MIKYRFVNNIKTVNIIKPFCICDIISHDYISWPEISDLCILPVNIHHVFTNKNYSFICAPQNGLAGFVWMFDRSFGKYNGLDLISEYLEQED